MTNLKNHPGMWLRDDAAKQFDKAEADHGIFRLSDAGRTEAQQQGLINRWNAGGPNNRPPYLYKPAMPANTSNHVRNGGIAIDSPDWRRFVTVCENYGFRHTYPDGDPVHFDFIGGTNAPAAPAFNQDTLNRQRYLNGASKADLVEDGREGPRTRAVYKEYQTYLKSRGFYAGLIDGVWGPATQAAHVRNVTPVTPLKPPTPVTPPKSPSTTGRPSLRRGSRGVHVTSLQRRLNTNYPLYSKLVIDGEFGNATEKVVKEFQRRAGLKVDGVVGPATWGALGL